MYTYHPSLPLYGSELPSLLYPIRRRTCHLYFFSLACVYATAPTESVCGTPTTLSLQSCRYNTGILNVTSFPTLREISRTFIGNLSFRRQCNIESAKTDVPSLKNKGKTLTTASPTLNQLYGKEANKLVLSCHLHIRDI